MRRLVLLSALLTLGGLLLLLPSIPLWSLVTTGSAGSPSFGSQSGTDDTTIIESLVGFGLIGVGLIFEVFSLFTDVGATAPGAAAPRPGRVGDKE